MLFTKFIPLSTKSPFIPKCCNNILHKIYTTQYKRINVTHKLYDHSSNIYNSNVHLGALHIPHLNKPWTKICWCLFSVKVQHVCLVPHSPFRLLMFYFILHHTQYPLRIWAWNQLFFLGFFFSFPQKHMSTSEKRAKRPSGYEEKLFKFQR